MSSLSGPLHSARLANLLLPGAKPCLRRWRLCRTEAERGIAEGRQVHARTHQVHGRHQGLRGATRRWVVERTFAWLGRCRRLAKDFERTIASAEAWVFIAHIRLLTRRLARP
ncbi:MAG: hypothetical protein E5Y79_09300 [Mesorhizobium sp.]|nr:MAG: hypothetical protein EOR08_28405 [Mesorhizobium sp.]TIL60477.1 MAG: hypothetical protein E5Y79_09300 [Mesorhizobium sp.]TIW68658.1 MAG: hypothetical protein E5V60_03980 [Mesorhizobium sp.]